MKKIVLTGAKGQLGSALHEIRMNYPGYLVLPTDIDELNITNKEDVWNFMIREKPDFVINCAAYTAVDKAEEETDKAILINAKAPAYLAQACDFIKARLIHISTDYVFDGKYYRPYNENHPVSPDSAYGHSKLAGEQQVFDASENALIIRTSWLYSTTGHNFVKTIRKYGKERDRLKVVFDQIGTPTYAPDLAEAIMELIQQSEQITGKKIFHFSNEGVCSWYDFALEIIKLSGITCEVEPLETKDYPLPANRPHYSVLNKGKIKKQLGRPIPYWKDSLKRCINILYLKDR